MAPASPARHVSDGVLLGANSLRDLCRSHPARKMKSPYFAHLGLGKRLVPYLGALRLRIATAVSRIVRGWTGPVSLYGIINIVLLATPSKVGRIAANRIVARMKSVRSREGRRSMFKPAGHARGRELLRLLVAREADNSVAETVAGFRKPRPAFAIPAPINFFPKTGLFGICERDHASAYHNAKGL